MCERSFSVGFGPGLYSMSPAKKTSVAGPPERQGRWIQFTQSTCDDKLI